MEAGHPVVGTVNLNGGFFDSPAVNNGDAFFNVRFADGCAMAVILVSDVCARRLSAAGDYFCAASK